jgi:hypothetical protein
MSITHRVILILGSLAWWLYHVSCQQQHSLMQWMMCVGCLAVVVDKQKLKNVTVMVAPFFSATELTEGLHLFSRLGKVITQSDSDVNWYKASHLTLNQVDLTLLGCSSGTRCQTL